MDLLGRSEGKLKKSEKERKKKLEKTYTTEKTSAIVSVDGAFFGIASPADVTLSAEQDGVNQGLWFVEIV